MKNSTLKQQATDSTYMYILYIYIYCILQAKYVYTVIISFQSTDSFQDIVADRKCINNWQGNVKLQINLYVSFIFYGRKNRHNFGHYCMLFFSPSVKINNKCVFGPCLLCRSEREVALVLFYLLKEAKPSQISHVCKCQHEKVLPEMCLCG